ncbi:unconventional myosin-Vc isoform X3 [Salmo salar]|nr:unconventional myosin-Vc isoform X3 [Salmo salar]
MGGETGIEGVDDRKDMEETRRTFSLLGLSEDFQADVFKVLAGILHLGNVEIRNVGSDRSSISSSDPHMAAFCDLLGVSPDGVTRWLCHRRFVMVAETVVKPVTSKRAVNARDALAKQIYAHLFDCVIHKINAALQVPGKQHSFIGVLDIYGFETFDVNSFEQFCINYANEKLQQQFNLHVFKLEQEEYMKEDIPWTLIDFYDNQPVIDLIEAKMGILDLLDEECLFPQGTDQNWIQKLYNYLVDNPLFEKPRMSNEAFIIQHFADKVEYQCWGFLEKNRDTLYEELIDTMRTSKFPLLANFFLEEEPGGVGSKGIKVRPARPGVKPANKNLRTTVGEKFRSSLYLLMETLNATTPHYVRCIKPNEEKMPFEYDSKRVVQQLRACGVLETIHISAQSYPSRWTYIEFYSRYSILMSQQELLLTDKKQTCRTVLQRLIQDSNQYKFGRTKIFFRAGQVAYLEKLRLDRLRGACVTIQKHVRGWSHRRTFLRMREAAVVLQQYVRGQRRIRKSVTAAALKQGWAAVVIQRYWRGYLTRQIYRTVRSSSIIIQAFTRGWIARKRYKKMVEVQKALILQKYARAWLARRRFQTLRRLVHNVQLSYRCQQLRKKLEDQGKENRGLLERLTGLAGAHAQGLDKLHSLEAQLGKSATEKASLEEREKKSKEDATKTIAQLQQEKDRFIVEKQDLEKKLADTAIEMKDSFDQIKTTLREDLEREERLRKIAENNLDLQKEDHEKEVEVLREENRRLKEERVRLQRQTEEGAQVNTDLQDQVIQLTKHVKVRLKVIGHTAHQARQGEVIGRTAHQARQGEVIGRTAHQARQGEVIGHTAHQARQGEVQRSLVIQLTKHVKVRSLVVQLTKHIKVRSLVVQLTKHIKVRSLVIQLTKHIKVRVQGSLVVQLTKHVKVRSLVVQLTKHIKVRSLVIQLTKHIKVRVQRSLVVQLTKHVKVRSLVVQLTKHIKVRSLVIQLTKHIKVRVQRSLVVQLTKHIKVRSLVIQLTKHVKVIPELRKDLHNLQTQRDDLDRRMKGQSEEAIAKMSVITRQLLGGMMEDEVISRLASDGPDQMYEAGDLLTAFDGLQKATRVLERKQKEQKDVSDSQIEGLTFKVEHLQNENNQLQKLFQEKMSVNDSIGQEVSRLNQENMVIPELKQTVSELQRHKQELEDRLEEQARGMTEKIEEMSKKLEMNVEEEASQRRLLEQHEQVEREKEEVERRVEELEEVLRRQKNAEVEAKARFSQETSRLTAENMDFEEQLDMKERLIRKLQNKIKSLQTSEKANQTPAPTIPKEYLGMLEYKREDEPKLIQYIILDLKPRGVVVNMIPNMAAQLLFMCVRHADYLNDGAKLKSLMNAIISGVKKVITDHQADFELLSFWLSNMYHMLNCLKQYSGEEEFMKQNSPRQNKNCLQNFDLSEHRQIFSDLAIRIYHQFISVMEKTLVPMIVPGMLEHESLQGISSMKPTGFRKRSNSIYEDQEIYTISSLLQQLSLYHITMSQHGMEEGLVRQAVKQTFFLVGAATLNNILLRKDMCSCRKGMQIRCNISYLEEWLKEKDLVQGTSAMETLKPLCQAAWLLQVNKTTDDDAKEIVEQCSELNTVQIVKILNSYTPIDDFEKRVAPSFVRKVQGLLQDREGGSSQLMLDTQYRFQVTFPFTPSSQALELLQLPSSLRLGFLTRI